MKNGFGAMNIWLAAAVWLCSVEVSTAAEQNNQPIQIKSNELVSDNATRTATFSGKVSARQGNITILTDKLVIRYAATNQEVEKVEAFGNVRIIQGNRHGEAAHAVYDNVGGKIILDGNPKVAQGGDVITGKTITYFVNEQKSEVSGGTEAVIHPREKAKSDGLKP